MQNMKLEADLSECGRYRYTLTRTWDATKPTVVFIGINPSTANADVEDPTSRRCNDFARRWDAGSMQLINLYAFRSTFPDFLYAEDADGERIGGVRSDAVGPQNDEFIARVLASPRVTTVVAAWGAHKIAEQRAAAVVALAERYSRQLMCLGLTKQGAPRHPLYVPKMTTLVPYGASHGSAGNPLPPGPPVASDY